ncbi:MAG: hypothetical protein ABSF53_09605 [Terracidiphilus sp.]|jgi:hypothetical protein
MEMALIHVSSATLEAAVVGLVIAGAIVLVRKIQLSLGVKDDKAEKNPHIPNSR